MSKNRQSTTILNNAKKAEQTIKDGVRDNLSGAQIANILRCSPSSVKLWAKILGIDIPRKKRKIPKDKKVEEFYKMRRLGCTLEEIGKSHGVTREYVRQTLARWYPDDVFPSRTRKMTVCQTCGEQFHPNHHYTKFCSTSCKEISKSSAHMNRDLAVKIMELRDLHMTWDQVNAVVNIAKSGIRFRSWLQRKMHFFSTAEQEKYFRTNNMPEKLVKQASPKSFITRILRKFGA